MTGTFVELEGHGYVRFTVSDLRLPAEITLLELRRLSVCYCECAPVLAVYRLDEQRKVWVRA